jgi:hypothetical protein
MIGNGYWTALLIINNRFSFINSQEGPKDLACHV